MKAKSGLQPQALGPSGFSPAEPGPAFPQAATEGQQRAGVKSSLLGEPRGPGLVPGGPFEIRVSVGS